MVRTILILSVVFVLAIPAHAGDWDPCNAEWGVSCSGMRISICPLGDFELIRDGCGGGNDYIWVHIWDNSGIGIAGIPPTDYWLQAADPAEELCLCANHIAADSATNYDGRTTISGPILVGGCAATGGLWLAVRGSVILDRPYCINVHVENIVIVSPDLNADCRVNLSDLAVFGFSYNKNYGEPGYNTCCDYNDDDHCNLSDFAYIGEHYLHECY